jgi:ABC-type antimicrobial peptide transport system permease subunit
MFILERMQLVSNAMILLSLVFNIVLLVFMAISVVLIYSLLMIGVETKTHETGMMRMVGTNKRGLVMMVFI